jgi:hypothetical protein
LHCTLHIESQFSKANGCQRSYSGIGEIGLGVNYDYQCNQDLDQAFGLRNHMGILLAFAPFIVFVLGQMLVGVTAGLVLAAVVAALLILKSVIAHQTLKVLEIGTLILFAGLAIYAKLAHPAWSIIAVRLRVDAGLLLVVLASLVLRKPFTLQYAREQVPAEIWSHPGFVRTNYVITAVWALAFAVMVLAEAAMLYVPGVPKRAGVIVTILAIYGAFRFTDSYPKRQKQQSLLKSRRDSFQE